MRYPTEVFRRLARSWPTLPALVLACAGPSAPAQTLLSEVAVVGGEAVETVVPLEGAGDYTLALIDQDFPVVDGFASLRGLLVDPADNSTLGTVALDTPLDFSVTDATQLQLLVVGELSGTSAAQFVAQVRDEAGDVVFTRFASVISTMTVSDTATTLLEEVTVFDAGDYELRIEDFRFPPNLDAPEAAGLDELLVQLVSQTEPLPPLVLYDLAQDDEGDPFSQTFDLPLAPDTLDLAAFATPSAGQRELGVFGLSLRGGPFGDALFAQSVLVIGEAGGEFAVTSFLIPDGATGDYTLTLTNFPFPVPLLSLTALVVRDGQVVGRLEQGNTVTFRGTANAVYQLIVDAVPDPQAGAGTFGAQVRGGPFDELLVDVIGSAESGEADDTVSLTFGIPEVGDYELNVVDFGFPGDVQSLTVLLLDGTRPVLNLSGPGRVQFSVAAPSTYTVVLDGAGDETAGGALVGVTVTNVDSGAVVLEDNVAFGADFASTPFTVTQAERHAVTLEDLRFTERFVDLRGVVTRGAQVVGTILSAGTFNFDATPGDYRLSIVAQTASNDVGTFASTVAVNPPPPPDPPDPPPDPPDPPGGGGGGSVLWLALIGLLRLRTPGSGQAGVAVQARARRRRRRA